MSDVETDQEPHALLAAWKGGDESVARFLVELTYPQLVRFFRNKMTHAPDEDDLVQQCMLAIIASPATPDRREVFWGLVYGIARNVLRQHVRQKHKRAREELDFDVVCIHDLAPRSLSSLAVRGGEVRAFIEALRRVSIADQTLLELRFFQGLTAVEISEALEIPRGSVQRRLDASVERLRQRIAEQTGGVGRPWSLPPLDALNAWAAEVRARMP